MTLEIRHDIPLAPLTTFKIGGKAKYFVSVRTTDDLRDAIIWARKNQERPVILAGGSNVLVSDSGIDGLVIHIVSDQFAFEGTRLTAEAGCNLLRLITESAERGYGGWESMAGIPGSIGGAVRGNAGAFGTEIKDFVRGVEALHLESGEQRDFDNASCDFSYRHSFFKDNPEWIVTRVTLDLLAVDIEASKAKIDETIAERERRHLQNVMAAGSFFMNPVAPEAVVKEFETEKNMTAREGRVPAGWLIEKSGMKGAVVGGAMASMQHPNYIVNTGSATASDVRELATKIKMAVHERFGVMLSEEAAIF